MVEKVAYFIVTVVFRKDEVGTHAVSTLTYKNLLLQGMCTAFYFRKQRLLLSCEVSRQRWKAEITHGSAPVQACISGFSFTIASQPPMSGVFAMTSYSKESRSAVKQFPDLGRETVGVCQASRGSLSILDASRHAD